MKIRVALLFGVAMLLGAWIAPGAIAADLTDVGFVDQADLANLPVFVNANRALAGYKAQLDSQFNGQVRRAHTDAQKQQIAMQFQQRLTDRQREIVGPLFQRAQLAIAAVSASRNISVVVDKRVVIYGGQDITKDVEAVFSSSQAIVPPAATPAPSEIGYVDQTQLDALPKSKSAQDTFMQFRQQLQTQLNQQLAGKTDAQKPAIIQSFNAQLSDEQKKVIQPLVDSTTKAITNVAKSKGLLLVIDQTARVYGGTDVTADVVKALQ